MCCMQPFDDHIIRVPSGRIFMLVLSEVQDPQSQHFDIFCHHRQPTQMWDTKRFVRMSSGEKLPTWHEPAMIVGNFLVIYNEAVVFTTTVIRPFALEKLGIAQNPLWGLISSCGIYGQGKGRTLEAHLVQGFTAPTSNGLVIIHIVTAKGAFKLDRGSDIRHRSPYHAITLRCAIRPYSTTAACPGREST
jgi:hypothetical protein